MKTKNIRQTVTIKASAHDIYEALLDAKKLSRFTGGEASISRKVGGKFSIYSGDVDGINLELISDKKIVQTWRYSDWPEGYYSKITFLMTGTKTGTRLLFTQIGVLEEFYDDIRQGCQDYYWAPMKEMLEK